MARRLFVPCLCLSMLAAAVACDPDLTPVKHGGDASPDATVTPNPNPNPGDSGTSENDGSITPTDGGEDDSSTPGAHKIDGVNDFKADEKFATTSLANGYEGFFAWDANRIYAGMSGNDVGSGATNKWVHVYLGVEGAVGTTTGIDYGGQQQPTLPFAATYHLRWKTSNDFTTVEKWNGGSSMWEAAGVANVPIVAAKQGNFMEMSVTRASIGATSKLKVHLSMLIEGGGADWTYAGVPSTSFTDGKDPNFGKYFDFDLTNASKAPGSYTPL